MPTDQHSNPRPIATSDLPWEEHTDIPRFTLRYKHLTRAALGSDYHVGVAIEELPPGMQSSPAHYHMFEEEHVFILAGSLTLRLGAERIEMRPGDYTCFPAGHRVGHCFVNSGTETCRYVVLGERNPNEVAVYTDSNKVLIRGLDRTVLDLAATRGYWDGEETGLKPGDLPAPASKAADAAQPIRPIASQDVAWEEMRVSPVFAGRTRHLTRAILGRNYHVGVAIESPGPGQRMAPLHYHMVEEEQALILEGEVRLLLDDESFDLKPGDYVCFPAGLKRGHSFLNIGKGPCSYLMIGERSPLDVCVYPQSNKLAVSALQSETDVFDMTATRGYWDGEID